MTLSITSSVSQNSEVSVGLTTSLELTIVEIELEDEFGFNLEIADVSSQVLPSQFDITVTSALAAGSGSGTALTVRKGEERGQANQLVYVSIRSSTATVIFSPTSRRLSSSSTSSSPPPCLRLTLLFRL